MAETLAEKSAEQEQSHILQLRELIGAVVVLLSAFLFVSLLTYVPGDATALFSSQGGEAQNAAGRIGALIAGELLYAMGYVSYILSTFVFLLGACIFLRARVSDLFLKVLSVFVFLTAMLLLGGLVTPEQFADDTYGIMLGYGGLWGEGFAQFIRPLVGPMGAWITVLVLSVISFFLGTKLLLYPFLTDTGGQIRQAAGPVMKGLWSVIRGTGRGLVYLGNGVRQVIYTMATGIGRCFQAIPGILAGGHTGTTGEAGPETAVAGGTGGSRKGKTSSSDSGSTSNRSKGNTGGKEMKPAQEASDQATTRETSDSSDQQDSSSDQIEWQKKRMTDDQEESEDSSTKNQTSGSDADKSDENAGLPERKQDQAYALPSLSYIKGGDQDRKEDDREFIEERMEIIEKTLESFGVEGDVVGVETGPVLTRFEFDLEPGIKVSKLMNRSDDLGIALKSGSIRIVYPIPGKSTVGIEVPNKHQGVVRLKSLYREVKRDVSRTSIPLMLGRGARGEPLVTDLAELPHLLIAGATNSGKSVGLKNIVLNQLLVRTPSEVKLMLIDPKMVELSRFEGIPHLVSPVMTDKKKVPRAFDWLVDYMEERYRLLQLTDVKDIDEYNELTEEEARDRIADSGVDPDIYPGKEPRIVVIVDELADLMMVASDEVEHTVMRIAQKARAVGIHLILSTQRPSSDVLTGSIKSNMPGRISFKVMSKVDSRIILDENGAQDLIGDGDMLVSLPHKEQTMRAQGVFVEDDEIDRVCNHWKEQAGELRGDSLPEIPDIREAETAKESEMRENLEEQTDESTASGEASPDESNRDQNESSESSEGMEERDDLFEDAIDIVVEEDRGSVSLLQRRLRIGYTRASRIMEQIADEGIVGPHRGNKPRQVLIDKDDWERLKEQGEML